MNINGISTSKITDLYKSSKIKLEKTNKTEKSDSIEISSAGKNLSSLGSTDIENMTEKKVENVRNEIQNGTYKRNATMIANKMIDIIKGREV